QALRDYLRHAESIALASIAKEHLAQVRQSQAGEIYAGCNEAISGYRQALTLWSGNAPAVKGLRRAREALARRALTRGDLVLARSEVIVIESECREYTVDGEPLKPPTALTAQVETATAQAAHRARVARLSRIAALAAAAIVIVVSVTAYLITKRQRDRAVHAEQIAKEAEQIAMEARTEEARQREIATDEKNRAIAANRELVYENYVNLVAVADARIKGGAFGKAEELLWKTPKHLRHWEWGHLMKQCHPDLLTLHGHAERVLAVAFSPDGRLLASADRGRKTILWDVRNGTKLRELPVTGGVCLAFSPDGDRLVTGHTSGEIRGWDVKTGKELWQLKGEARTSEASWVRSVAFFPDGRRLATAGDDGTVRVWNIDAKRELLVLECNLKSVRSVAVSLDGRRIAAGGFGEKLHMWEADTGEELWSIESHNAVFVTFSPDSRWLATRCGKDIELLHADTGKLHRKLEGHTHGVSSAAFSSDGHRLVTGDGLGILKVWDLQSGRVETTFSGHGGRVYSVMFSPDGRLVASASADET
ncbi:MAG: WD40 repeat domain-containing protein, partial [Lentisphaeria bacterium]|nr:WD40 repeat domain-containing protein [Lentisphaeria bacterium]